MNRLPSILSQHPRIVAVVMALIVLSIIFVLLTLPKPDAPTEEKKAEENSLSTDGEDEKLDQVSEPASPQLPETGGAGTPQKQQLVLSGWDTPTKEGASLAQLLSPATQTTIITALLRDYTQQNTTSAPFLYGTITAPIYTAASSSQQFTVTIQDNATYSVTVIIQASTIAITAQGGRNVAL